MGTVLCAAQPAPAGVWPWSRAEPAQPAHPAVVRVLSEEPDGISQGSGTLVDVRGDYALVVTNWHVVRDATGAINVVFPDGFRSAARVLRVDRDWDLAALAIWRPNARPVPLAGQAPRPGDRLTIAGYGSGSYRAATGRCTQYVAPGTQHPYEMVEVSAAARQGDSGGPIFNERGELAGVLFGSASGTTSGSYAGRVREFLATAWPPPEHSTQDATRDPEILASRPLREDRPLQRLPQVDERAISASEPTDLTPLPPVRPTDQIVHTDALPPWEGPAEAGEPPKLQPTTISWHDLAGTTLYEQVKSLLAVIGLALVFLKITQLGQPR